MQKIFATGFLLTMCASWLTQPAYAYLDPGTASVLLQALIGGIAAGGAVISLNYQRLKLAIAKRFSKGQGKANS